MMILRNSRKAIVVGLAAFFLVPIDVIAASEDVTAPAADETLIYVIREGRFIGAANGYWVAINDQTVARVRNKKHAIIRVKAGVLTLNLANSGVVVAATAIDNRPGETVYLKWRLGDVALTELDESAARKMLRKSKRMEPIDEPLPNNQQMAALLNLSRLGFDLMQPAAQRLAPDEEHAVLTIFRRGEADKLEFGVWGSQGFVGTLRADEATSIALPAGEHFFLAGNVGTTFLKAQLEAGHHYYAMLDYGKMLGRVRLTPVSAHDSSNLDSWLDDVSWVRVDADVMTDSVRARENIVGEFIRTTAERTRTGESDFALLGNDNAF